MDTMTKRTVYQDTPDIYESDLRQIVNMMDFLKSASVGSGNDLFIEEATIVVGNMNGYTVGTLTLDEDFWCFTPHNDSDVEADIDVT